MFSSLPSLEVVRERQEKDVTSILRMSLEVTVLIEAGRPSFTLLFTLTQCCTGFTRWRGLLLLLHAVEKLVWLPASVGASSRSSCPRYIW